jgi:hypothetical protein
MNSRDPTVLQVAAVLLVLFFSGCKAPDSVSAADRKLADRLEKLPTLPADIEATLDPRTNATKTAGVPPEPEKLASPLAHAPCCSIRDQKQLKVRVTLTKCGPLRDFVLAPLSDLVMARDSGGSGVAPSGPNDSSKSGSTSRAYKLNTVNRTSVWDTTICVTSEGPWDATFIEERHCANYAPQDSLFVSAWGSLYGYYWNGGTTNHPPEVSVVACRDTGTFRSPCGALGTCNCTSNTCPADQPCACDPPW